MSLPTWLRKPSPRAQDIGLTLLVVAARPARLGRVGGPGRQVAGGGARPSSPRCRCWSGGAAPYVTLGLITLAATLPAGRRGVHDAAAGRAATRSARGARGRRPPRRPARSCSSASSTGSPAARSSPTATCSGSRSCAWSAAPLGLYVGTRRARARRPARAGRRRRAPADRAGAARRRRPQRLADRRAGPSARRHRGRRARARGDRRHRRPRPPDDEGDAPHAEAAARRRRAPSSPRNRGSASCRSCSSARAPPASASS